MDMTTASQEESPLGGAFVFLLRILHMRETEKEQGFLHILGDFLQFFCATGGFFRSRVVEGSITGNPSTETAGYNISLRVARILWVTMGNGFFRQS